MNTPTPEEFYRNMHLAGGEVVKLAQDTRDYVFGSKDPDNRWCPFQWDLTKLPRAKNLLSVDSDRQDQGQLNSCVGNSEAKLLEIHLRESQVALEMSRMFIYYNGRKRTADVLNVPVTDSGTSIALCMAELTKKGVALESVWPYVPSLVNIAPTASAFTDGATRLVGRYERLGTSVFSPIIGNLFIRNLVADVKVAINCGMPVVFGLPLNRGFFNISGPLSTHKAQYDPHWVDTYGPDFIGYHAMCIVGYDDDLGCFIVENSWGTGWGDNGLCAMSYESLTAITFDCFAVREFCGVRHEIPDELYGWDAKLLSRQVSFDFGGIPGQVYRLYQTAFSRRPDWDGLGYWIWAQQQGLAPAQIAQQFTGSAEFLSKYGNTDNRTFVKLLYNQALYRDPDQGGWDWHTNLLDNGTLTRGETMISFSESAENKENCLFYYGNSGINYFKFTP